MTLLRLAGLLAACVATAGAQQADTIVPGRDASAIDASRFRPHVVAVTQTFLKNGAVVRTSRFTNTWTVESTAAGPIIALRIDTDSATAAAAGFHIQMRFDGRTTMPRSVAQQFGSGRAVEASLDDTRLRGWVSPERDAPRQAFDVTLATPSQLSSVVDLSLSFVTNWAGKVVRVPVFGLAASQRHTEWMTFHAVGMDTTRIGNRVVQAQVVESDGPGRDRLWIVQEPPFITLWTTRAPDGSEMMRLEQRLVGARAERPPGMTKRGPGTGLTHDLARSGVGDHRPHSTLRAEAHPKPRARA